MPDKWEYPWYAAWDLAFHCVTLALIDPDFAKDQLVLLTREWYMHPNGQLPAYEWAFGDVNPPVHAWAAWRVYEIDRDTAAAHGDRAFLERVFHKLMLNFTWWVNRKDAEGRNIFQGGFLGLDNIGIFDRSAPLPTGGHINQSDGTAWMAMYTLNLMRIALELAVRRPRLRRHRHQVLRALPLHRRGDDQYRRRRHRAVGRGRRVLLRRARTCPTANGVPLRVRSMVGLIPLFAVEVLDGAVFARLPTFTRAAALVPRVTGRIWRGWCRAGTSAARRAAPAVAAARPSDEAPARRACSTKPSSCRITASARCRSTTSEHPFVFEHDGDAVQRQLRARANRRPELFGGNSNWRGPIWMPVNFLLIELLRRFHSYYGDDFTGRMPGRLRARCCTLGEVADEIVAPPVAASSCATTNGRRPVFGDCAVTDNDPQFRDHVLFYEYFHGDTGRGLGAAHQTGWTGLIALLLTPLRATASDPEAAFAEDRADAAQ